MCLETGGWCSDTFRVCDMDDFTRWIRLWPEVDFEMSNDDTVRLYPAWDLDYAPNLPDYRYDARARDYVTDEGAIRRPLSPRAIVVFRCGRDLRSESRRYFFRGRACLQHRDCGRERTTVTADRQPEPERIQMAAPQMNSGKAG